MINYTQAISLKNFRERSGLTQTELAIQLQTTRSQISMAEKGLRPLSKVSEQLFAAFRPELLSDKAQEDSSMASSAVASKQDLEDFKSTLELKLAENRYSVMMYMRRHETMMEKYPILLETYNTLKRQETLPVMEGLEKVLAVRLHEVTTKLDNVGVVAQMTLQLKIDLLLAEAVVITENLQKY